MKKIFTYLIIVSMMLIFFSCNATSQPVSAHTIGTQQSSTTTASQDITLVAAVKTNNGCGYIDEKGNFLTNPNPQFINALNFSEGLAAIQFENGKIGFIDSTGKTIIQPQFDSVLSFSEGLAYVELDGKSAFIDKRGNIVFTLGSAEKKDSQGNFEDGYTYDHMSYHPGFFNGYSEIGYYSSGKVYYGLINRNGEWVVEPKFHNTTIINNKIFEINENGKNYIFQNTGEDMTDKMKSIGATTLYIKGQNDSSDLIAFENAESKWGYINSNFEIVIKPTYDFLTGYSEGLSVVSNFFENNKILSGFIDLNGSPITDIQFTQAEDFSDGLALVGSGDVESPLISYIDKTGKTVFSLSKDYIGAKSFANGLALVQNQSGYGYIDKTGKVTLPCQYLAASDFAVLNDKSNANYIVQPANLTDKINTAIANDNGISLSLSASSMPSSSDTAQISSASPTSTVKTSIPPKASPTPSATAPSDSPRPASPSPSSSAIDNAAMLKFINGAWKDGYGGTWNISSSDSKVEYTDAYEQKTIFNIVSNADGIYLTNDKYSGSNMVKVQKMDDTTIRLVGGDMYATLWR